MKPARRDVLRGAAAATLLPLLPPVSRPLAATSGEEPAAGFTLSASQRAALRAAANRIVPPFSNDQFNDDDPIAPFRTFRGAGEEGAVDYVERLLTAFDHDPPRIYASTRQDLQPAGETIGSRSELTECRGGHLSVTDGWLPLPPDKEKGWRAAIARFQAAYAEGLDRLNEDSRRLFGDDFASVEPVLQTALLEAYDGLNPIARIGQVYTAGGGEPALRPTFGGAEENPRGAFFNMLFTHVIESLYGDPIYGGNRDRIGWKLVAFGGPRHPEGYFREELETVSSCDTGVPFNFSILDSLESGS